MRLRSCLSASVRGRSFLRCRNGEPFSCSHSRMSRDAPALSWRTLSAATSRVSHIDSICS